MEYRHQILRAQNAHWALFMGGGMHRHVQEASNACAIFHLDSKTSAVRHSELGRLNPTKRGLMCHIVRRPDVA